MQGIIVFASVMATLGLQILLESGRQFVNKVCNFNTIFFDSKGIYGGEHSWARTHVNQSWI